MFAPFVGFFAGLNGIGKDKTGYQKCYKGKYGYKCFDMFNRYSSTHSPVISNSLAIVLCQTADLLH